MFKKVINKNKTDKQEIGEFGENLAINYLKKNKYKIIDKNIKVSYKEIDIIAKKNNYIIFIEVKTRIANKFANPEEGMNHSKTKNLKKALNIYSKLKNINPEKMQIDLICVLINKEEKKANIKHYKEVF